jgi:hypothetical protein
MRHPSESTLRRLLDEPDGVADADREHIAACRVCLSALQAAREDATVTGAALDVEASTDVDEGWRRLSQSMAIDGLPAVAGGAPARARRWRAALRNPVAAAVGVVALLTGASAAAAADWLQIFRTEQIAPVAVTQADLVALPDLSAYGDVAVTQEPNLREVAGAAAAERPVSPSRASVSCRAE